MPKRISLLIALLLFPLTAHAHDVRIVGGAPASPGAWPFMAAILDSSGDPTTQFCGGSLIAPTWVVSAAHCFRETNGSNTPAANVRIGLGLYQLSQGGGTIYTVKRIIIHPQYDSNTSDFDMALVELNGTSGLTPATPNFTSTDVTGFNATAIGWGLTDPNNNNSTSDVLRQVTLPIVSNTACNVPYSGGITARMVCAGLSQGGKDTCQGDSGGPLVATVDGVVRLVGVTSFGDGCASPGVFGVYSRVSAFESFITQYVSFGPPPTPTDGKYGGWNGYLGMTNILELLNRSNSAVTAQVNMIAADGTLVSSSFFAVPASSQQDVILNGLQGFQADAYGLVQVSSNIDGRVFFYRPTDSTNYDYAFGVPLFSSVTGTTSVAFNTYNPSFNPSDIANPVFNWLSIINLSGSTQSFTINKYSDTGSLIDQRAVSVNATSRADFEGGHDNPGPSHFGLIEVVPANNGVQYFADIMRYGTGPNNSYDFAFPLIAKAGDTGTLAVELGSTSVAKNYLEVVNPSASSNTVELDFYNQGGGLVSVQDVTLGAHAQQHFDVNGVLGDLNNGYARLTSLSSLPVISESMFYFRNPASGSITSMYGQQADLPLQGTVHGSYNFYIGMEDYLRIINPNDQAVSMDVTVSSLSSAGSSRTITLPANNSVVFALNDPTFGTVVNSYGMVVITPTDSSKKLVYSVLRVKHAPTGDLEFTAPTALN